MTRDEMIDRLVERDIESIKQDLFNDNVWFLNAVLRGGGYGWVQYELLSDEEVVAEYEEMVDNEVE